MSRKTLTTLTDRAMNEKQRYCGDCANYIPGGGYPNCIANRAKNNKYRTTCPLAYACGDFKEKEEER